MTEVVLAHEHSYRLLVTRLADGRVGIERQPTLDPRYPFRCGGCGDVQHASLEQAAAAGWVVLLDVARD